MRTGAPALCGPLFVAMAHEIALAEQRDNAKDERLRATLLEVVQPPSR